MRKHLKKYFIPHKKNNYHPHLFRNTSVIIISFVTVFLLGVSYGNSVFLRQTVMGANIATNVLIDLANVNRVKHNIEPLKKNDKLALAAELKANDMIQDQYFAHFAPDGTTPWYFITKAGYEFSYAGENLAINFTESESVDKAWMSSPLHRGNLLNKNFKDVGIAAVDGRYNETNSIYVVQMFGSPANNPAPTPKVIPEVKIVEEDKKFISVKNISTSTSEIKTDVRAEVLGTDTYSSWTDKFIFDSPFYIQLALIFFVIILTIGVTLRIFIEYKKQHYRHIVISVLFMLFVLVLASFNLNFINSF